MLSFEELNKHNENDNFLSILKEKLSKKRYDKIIQKSNYNKKIIDLQIDLVNLQNWVSKNNKRLCIIFEGRDAAGKGGAIKRFVEHLNPRNSRVVALAEPTQIEKGQWYFQRYLKEIPNPGEIVFFDRSWYNRAIVEPVMGFCNKNDYELFMSQVNDFEKMLIDDGVILIKLWFSISKEEQRKRFINRLSNPLKTWKFSEVDMEGQKKWDIYTGYKERMFSKTDSDYAPWKIIDSNHKLEARINSIEYVLSRFEKFEKGELKLSCHSDNTHCEYRPIRLSYEATQDLANMGVCLTPDTNLGNGTDFIINPGNINRSVLHFRMTSNEEQYRMPLIGRSIVHDEAIEMIEEWITSLENDCN